MEGLEFLDGTQKFFTAYGPSIFAPRQTPIRREITPPPTPPIVSPLPDDDDTEVEPDDCSDSSSEVVMVKEIPKEPTKKPTKERNLTPDMLADMLAAEVDHFLKIEDEIASYAEVQMNVEVADHERAIAHVFTMEDDSEELRELEALDAEIMRLETILAQKMASVGE